MEIQKPTLAAILVLCLSVSGFSAATPSPDDFDHARNYIKNRSKIEYNQSFCSIVASGGDKIACRLKKFPSIGFLVCKKEINDEDVRCKEIIEPELENFSILRSANITSVTVDKAPIYNVTCNGTNNQYCSGFLEGWIDNKDGEFGHVRDHISEGTVDQLINSIIKFTKKEGLKITVKDLKKIVEFMQPSVSGNNYKQICDLQGFFLKKGGFLVSDTPHINKNIAINGSCWEGEPTTQEVLNALNKMIVKFSEVGTASAQNLNVSLFQLILLSIISVLTLDW